MKPDSDNSMEPVGQMTDSRLDELLELAQPRVDRGRQKRLQRRLGRLLKANRPTVIFGLGFGDSSRIMTAAVGLLLVGWIGWKLSERPYLSPEIPDIAEVDSSLSAEAVSNFVERAVDEPNATPSLIVTRVVSSNRLNQTARRTRLSADLNSQRKQLKRYLTSQLMRLGESEIGLHWVEQMAITLDDANRDEGSRLGKARHRGSVARQRASKRTEQLEWLNGLRSKVENELAERLHDSNQTTAVTAFRLLCRCGSQRSLPTILKHWDKPSVRSDVAVAANRLANSNTLGQLIASSDDAEVRLEMMTQLLRRGDAYSVDLFLGLTSKYELHAIAQASGATVEGYSADYLLRRLQSNRRSIARAAAITLSRMDDKQIPLRLMKLAQRPEARQASVMALTARRDVESLKFVERAAHDLRSLATVKNAKKKWNQLAVAL